MLYFSLVPVAALLVFGLRDKNIAVSNPNGAAATERDRKAPAAMNVLHPVPFISQAPFGDWSDPFLKDGCEEASILMAFAWARGESLAATEADSDIKKLSQFEIDHYGFFRDLSAADTSRLMKDYFNYDSVVKYGIDARDVKAELARGNLLIIPVDGTKLNNPYYAPPGPERHMLVVVGYDGGKNEFIAHDPGTQRGMAIRYNEAIFEKAIGDYASGDHPLPGGERKKAMVIVSK